MPDGASIEVGNILRVTEWGGIVAAAVGLILMMTKESGPEMAIAGTGVILASELILRLLRGVSSSGSMSGPPF